MQQTEFKFCSYPGCQELANPNFEDEIHGGIYCSQHFVLCPNCHNNHGKQEFTKLTTGKYKDQTAFYCKDCFGDNHMQCPNCNEVILRKNFYPQRTDNAYSMKKGGCSECSMICKNCDKVIDKDNVLPIGEGNVLCESCHGEAFSYCEEHGDYVDNDDMVFVGDDENICSNCYKEKYVKCYECDEEIEKAYSEEYDGEHYCEKCIKGAKVNVQYKNQTEKFQGFTYTPKDKFLNQLQKILPISVKKLKTEHPSIAAGLSDLISFSKGQELTDTLVYNYRVTLNPENFPVKYSTWDDLQRSTNRLVDPPEKDQLVLIIETSKNMKNKLDPISNGPLVWLFESINGISERSGHPSTPDQIGWARLELDPNGESKW